jgi:LPLT family lysophospholipid transporter-like MFS transporter
VLKLTTMTQINLLGLWLSIGLMLGSVAAGQLYPVGELRHTRRYGWLLAGTVAALGSLGWLMGQGLDHPKVLSTPILIVTGFAAGLFLIPLNAALQAESRKDKLGKTNATQNGFENFAMLAGSLLAFFQVKFGFHPSELLLALAFFVSSVVIWLKIPAQTSKRECHYSFFPALGFWIPRF